MTAASSDIPALASFRRLAADYAKVRQPSGPALELVALLIERVGAPTTAPGVGWVREASVVRRCEGDEPLFRPLFGEWLAGDEVNSSMTLRSGVPHPGETAAWRLSHRGLGPNDDLRHGEVPALRERVTVLGAMNGESARAIIAKDKDAAELPVLAYDIYWGGDDSDASIVRRVACRFAGFGTEAGHVLPPPDSRQRRGG
jgi:hypothetical protein